MELIPLNPRSPLLGGNTDSFYRSVGPKMKSLYLVDVQDNAFEQNKKIFQLRFIFICNETKIKL